MDFMNPQVQADGRQSETAFALQRGVSRILRDHGCATLTEVTLASGRRADIMALRHDGAVWIVEIKSSMTDFRVDQKWPEYRNFSDRLYFAIPPTLDAALFPEDAGLIIADQWGGEIAREAPDHPLHPTRRKAVTLLFARAAATRLHGLWDPQI